MVFALATPIVAAIGKKAAPKKAPAKTVRKVSGARRQGNIGPNRTLWNGFAQNPEAPAYLDGTLPGDAGFDPLGLSAPVEYLQFDLDSLNQSGAVNKAGGIIGKLKKVDNAPTERTIVVRIFTGKSLTTDTGKSIEARESMLRAASTLGSRGADAGRAVCETFSEGASWIRGNPTAGAVSRPRKRGPPVFSGERQSDRADIAEPSWHY